MPLRREERYDERPGLISSCTTPPASVMRPACTAAVQIDESLVYSPVPHSEPGEPAGHVYIGCGPPAPVVAQPTEVAFVDHVIVGGGGGLHIPARHDSPIAQARSH